jgi:hypothetical protein
MGQNQAILGVNLAYASGFGKKGSRTSHPPPLLSRKVAILT